MVRVRDELRRLARGQRSTVVAAPTVPRAYEGTGVLPTVSPAPIPAPAQARRRRGGLNWGLIAAVAVLAVAAIVTAYVLAGRGTPEALPDDAPASSGTSETSETTSTPPLSAEDTREQMDAFITSYIATVTSDPRAAFDQLTPEFQEASGGYDGYMGWWSQVRTAELSSVSSDPSDLTVGYTIDYVMKTGRRSTQHVRLQLQRFDDKYLIAGEG
jgi:hypothetical protein